MTWEEFAQKDADMQRYLAQYQQIEGITLDRLEKVEGAQTRWLLAHYQQI